ncbi:tyrosine-type recombinase/integrase, partial [uncultured Oscillibacter sp.]|uniref:tyrosine-type recombinase/integrase n=1 Tax=uncultured Oscillibacter sp. TaxID=876091 RepID=UPI002618DCB3
KDEGYYEVFLLELTTGLRVGELMALQWDDLNFNTGELRIERQVYRTKEELLIQEPKTKASILRLDHTSVQVTTDGYATKTSTLSASRSYPNLSEADTSLIPKTIEDKGKTLTLGDVKWSESMDVDGEGKAG